MFKILSLDGGGSWALLQAMALEHLFGDADGHAILSRFDLAAANSGGSIVLAGLVKGMRPSQIGAQFRTQALREQIFVGRSPLARAGSSALAPWDDEGKRRGLRALMNAGPHPVGDLTLEEAAARIVLPQGRKAPRLMIAAYDVDRNRGRFFRSFDSELATEPYRFSPTLADAVHASSHAPVFYFARCAVVADKVRPADRRRFWDGALAGMNNPVLGAVIETIANKWNGEEIAALSIGTGTAWRPVAPADQAEHPRLLAPMASLDLIDSAKRVASTILGDPPDNASRDAHFLIGDEGEQRLVRMSPVVKPEWNPAGRWEVNREAYGAIDAADPLGALIQLLEMDMDAVGQAEVDLIVRLGMAWLGDRVPNQGLMWNPANGAVVRGNLHFSGALARWRQLDGWSPPIV